jgi:CRISPR-associated protein Cmr1
MPLWKPPFQGTDLPYALFPFQGQLADGRRQIEVAPASCIHSANFRLTIICDKTIDFSRDVEPAVWAWVNFGGLGSRTRRGCGAIKCANIAANDRNDLIAWLRSFQSRGSAKEWPTLADAILVGNETNDALAAWNVAIKTFREFRQGEGVGRNPGQQPNRPGRSRWPEPETIRRVTGKRHSQHQRMNDIPDDAFPRAELGLPIVFLFKEQGQGEPLDTVLYPAAGPEGKRERMASPLILKPVALRNGKFLPLIVRLKTLPLEAVDLRQKEQSLQLPNPTLIRGESLARYQQSPMQNRSANGSAIEAFLAYAKSQGFSEVTR